MKIKFLLTLLIILFCYSISKANKIADIKENIETIYSQAKNIPEKLKIITETGKTLNPKIKCLEKIGTEECKRIGCVNRKECSGIVLSELVKLLKAITNSILGTIVIVDGKEKYQPSAIYAVLDTLGKLPNLLPDTFKTGKTGGIFEKVEMLATKVSSFNKKLSSFTEQFNNVLEFLNSLAFALNPEKAIKDIPVEPLPPIQLSVTT